LASSIIQIPRLASHGQDDHDARLSRVKILFPQGRGGRKTSPDWFYRTSSAESAVSVRTNCLTSAILADFSIDAICRVVPRCSGRPGTTARFCSKVFPMTSFSDTQRFRAILTVATGVLLATGCRSASVNAPSGPDPAYAPASPQPFYRSYERAPRPYDENYQPPSPPPDILPVPGYSEPSVPPSPSTQKQRRSWFPAASRPSNDPPNADVNQTGTNGMNRGGSATPGTSESLPLIPPMPPAQTIGLQTEPVPLNLAAPADHETRIPSISPSKMPVKTRYGTISPWPYAKNTTVPRAAASESGESKSSSAIDQNPSTSASDIPLLLPPNP